MQSAAALDAQGSVPDYCAAISCPFAQAYCNPCVSPAMMLRFALAVGLVLLTTHGSQAANSPRLGTPRSGTPRSIAAQRVRFEAAPTTIGEQVDQQIAVQLDLNTRITQAGQLAHESNDQMRRQQRRIIQVTSIKQGRLHTARVQFASSRMQSPNETNPEQAKQLVTQPIEGKTYLVRRDEKQLHVTDEKGDIPPLEEYKLVTDSLSMLGKPNLLAKFLIDRQPQIGQRVLVPRAIAKSMLGMGKDMGAVKRFELELLRVLPPAGPPAGRHAGPPAGPPAKPRAAVFRAKIETMANDDSPMAFSIEGQVEIELQGCRTTATRLNGPIGMTSTTQADGSEFHYAVEGQIQMDLRSAHSRP